MKSEEFVKNVYVSEIEGPSRRGRPLGRWKDRVKEYISEKKCYVVEGEGLNKQGGSVWIGRDEGCYTMATPWGMFPEGARHQSYR